MFVHLSIGVWWNPSCTKNTLTKPLCLPLWKKQNEWLESTRDMPLSIDGGPMWFSKMIEWLV
jgi:hypothetical protein